MGAPLGNQYKKGKLHPGKGGRPSAYVEKATADTLANMYFKSHNQKEIEKALENGKFSIQQRHIFNAMKGDQRAINTIFSKLFPDKIETDERVIIKMDI
mgnify:FL=1